MYEMNCVCSVVFLVYPTITDNSKIKKINYEEIEIELK